VKSGAVSFMSDLGARGIAVTNFVLQRAGSYQPSKSPQTAQSSHKAFIKTQKMHAAAEQVSGPHLRIKASTMRTDHSASG